MADPQITANGLDLNSAWCQVEDLTTLLTPAARRGDNIVVPGRHGAIRTTNKRYNVTDVVIPMHVKGVDRDTGAIPADPLTQLQENIDELLRTFHADTVLLVYTRGDGSARTATAELTTDPAVITKERSSPPLARVSAALQIFGAFWEDSASVSQTITGATGVEQELTAFEGATAPMSDLLITFYGPVNNPMLTHGDRWVKYNGVVEDGQQLQLDTETWQVSPGAGAVWSPDPRNVDFGRPPGWLELDPAISPFSVVFTHTTGTEATCTIAGRRQYLSP